jgi:hypothetical protein
MHNSTRILAVVTGANRGMGNLLPQFLGSLINAASLGKVVIQKLVASGMEVVATSRSFDASTKETSGKTSNIHQKINWHKLDVSEYVPLPAC